MYLDAIDILGKWRASHIYPMHIFRIRLKEVSQKFDKHAIVVQRLKRTLSIIKKLKRKYSGKDPSMKLTQMQDIAGCRSVVSNVKSIKEIYNYYMGGSLRHRKVNEKDYISKPKNDGYRVYT